MAYLLRFLSFFYTIILSKIKPIRAPLDGVRMDFYVMMEDKD
jgi:hypothetical protein